MAEVILVEMTVDQGPTKLAVLKRIWPELAADTEFVRMFLREAQISASMDHPNIVKTFEVLGDAPRPAIALEYLDGQPLARVLNRLVGPNSLSWPLRLRILANVLAALHHAHELTIEGVATGIVHRDVNPQNVFVTYDGRVKLLDFGVAKSRSGSYQTRPGTVKGKLTYMAPEQLLNQPVDRRADIFAVGVMLWEMAAGRRLWQGMTESAIIQYLSARVPIRPIPVAATSVPHGLAKICSRALTLDPARRYATAVELASDLRRLIPGSDESHGRHLGKVVSLAFGEEHALRQMLIARHTNRARAITSADTRDDAEADLAVIPPTRATPGAMWTVDEPSLTSESATGASDPIATTVPPAEPSRSQTLKVRRGSWLHTILHIPPSGIAWASLGFAIALFFVVCAPRILQAARAWRSSSFSPVYATSRPQPSSSPPPLSASVGSHPQDDAPVRLSKGIIIAPLCHDPVVDVPVPSKTSGAISDAAVVAGRTQDPRTGRGRGRPRDREDVEQPRKTPRLPDRSREVLETSAPASGTDEDDILQPSIDLTPSMEWD